MSLHPGAASRRALRRGYAHAGRACAPADTSGGIQHLSPSPSGHPLLSAPPPDLKANFPHQVCSFS